MNRRWWLLAALAVLAFPVPGPAATQARRFSLAPLFDVQKAIDESESTAGYPCPAGSAVSRVCIAPDAEAAAQIQAERIYRAVMAAVESHGRAYLILATGETPKKAYRILIGSPRYASLPWNLVHIQMLDEYDSDTLDYHDYVRRALIEPLRSAGRPLPVICLLGKSRTAEVWSGAYAEKAWGYESDNIFTIPFDEISTHERSIFKLAPEGRADLAFLGGTGHSWFDSRGRLRGGHVAFNEENGDGKTRRQKLSPGTLLANAADEAVKSGADHAFSLLIEDVLRARAVDLLLTNAAKVGPTITLADGPRSGDPAAVAKLSGHGAVTAVVTQSVAAVSREMSRRLPSDLAARLRSEWVADYLAYNRKQQTQDFAVPEYLSEASAAPMAD